MTDICSLDIEQRREKSKKKVGLWVHAAPCTTAGQNPTPFPAGHGEGGEEWGVTRSSWDMLFMQKGWGLRPRDGRLEQMLC